jgi:tRNA threonylcarbamoyladenosine dehydratase
VFIRNLKRRRRLKNGWQGWVSGRCILKLVEPVQISNTDFERRFGGLRRLYGDQGYANLRAARVAVIGLGGVGSWAVEALARSGVASLILIDLDHVSESNINRQVQALGSTVGQSKAVALQDRIADIHPACQVHVIEEFVEPSNWPQLLPEPVDAVIDACDQVHAKTCMAVWALAESNSKRKPFLVMAGAAGGKRMAHAVQLADLAQATHDPLLAAVRRRLRHDHAAPRLGNLGVMCAYSKEPVVPPESAAACEPFAIAPHDNNLNCHGYGSCVTVTAAFGLVCAGVVMERVVGKKTD